MRGETVTSNTTSHTSSEYSEESARQRKAIENVPQIGYSLEELNAKRNEPKWRVMRYGAIVLFWGIWVALLAGAILIIVLNNHDVTSTSTTSAPTSTTKKH